MVVTMGIYYLLPWVRWDRGPDVPNQAFLIDLAHERLFFFWFELWPQELYLHHRLPCDFGAGAVPRSHLSQVASGADIFVGRRCGPT